jgi:hypothetical protein
MAGTTPATRVFIDAHGHLKIIDRVKDVGRIKGGANDGAMFAPKYVENKLKFFSAHQRGGGVMATDATACA